MAIGIKRRRFIAALGGAAAIWPLAARAQQAASFPVIGWLSGRSSETDALVLPAFRRGLNEQSFAEGRNVTIEYRWAEGRYDRIPALAADFVRRSVNVIAVAGVDERSYLTVQAATSSIPIVFLAASNPVKIGLVPNYNHPGGNITGITSLFVEIGKSAWGSCTSLAACQRFRRTQQSGQCRQHHGTCRYAGSGARPRRADQHLGRQQ